MIATRPWYLWELFYCYVDPGNTHPGKDTDAWISHRLFDKLQSIAMGRGTVLDYVSSKAEAVVDDLNELDNEEYEL